MALQSGVVQFRGKLGQTVGRRNGNKSITTTVTRNMNVLAVAPATVSNPKTAKQASQRMKMRAAINFYRGLRDILNHSWQGTAYRAQSRNEFMQRALNDASLVIPFLTKGDTRFVPGSYPLSSGSLAPVNVVGLEDPNHFVTTLALGSSQWSTIGQLSADIINHNVGFVNGDKIVFIVVNSATSVVGEQPASQNDYYFTPVALSFVLDVDSVLPIEGTEPFNVLSVTTTGGKMTFDFGSEFLTPVAAAVIHTRVPDNGSATWQRSNSFFYLAESLLALFMDPAQFNIALASYQSKEANVNSDWYLNIGTFEGRGESSISQADIVVSNVNIGTLPASGQMASVNVGATGALTINGVVYIVISEVQTSGNGRYLTRADGNSLYLGVEAIPELKSRIEAKGYNTIQADVVTSVYGIDVITTDVPGEDEP